MANQVQRFVLALAKREIGGFHEYASAEVSGVLEVGHGVFDADHDAVNRLWRGHLAP
jgi:hypothetical protein